MSLPKAFQRRHLTVKCTYKSPSSASFSPLEDHIADALLSGTVEIGSKRRSDLSEVRRLDCTNQTASDLDKCTVRMPMPRCVESEWDWAAAALAGRIKGSTQNFELFECTLAYLTDISLLQCAAVGNKTAPQL